MPAYQLDQFRPVVLDCAVCNDYALQRARTKVGLRGERGAVLGEFSCHRHFPVLRPPTHRFLLA
jgi:hypothetical protein